jgi:hypothetical protein
VPVSLSLFKELNKVNLNNVPRGGSLNATARALVRTAYGETASFNCLGPGEFDMLLGKITKNLISPVVLSNPSLRYGCSNTRATCCISLRQRTFHQKLAAANEA